VPVGHRVEKKKHLQLIVLALMNIIAVRLLAEIGSSNDD
jgi:hypothetical protein